MRTCVGVGAIRCPLPQVFVAEGRLALAEQFALRRPEIQLSAGIGAHDQVDQAGGVLAECGVDALAQDGNVEILHAGQAAELAQPRRHRLDLAVHTDSGGANHGQLLARILGHGLVYRRAVNHYAQRRDDSYRRQRTEIDRPCDRRRGAGGQRQTAHYNRFFEVDCANYFFNRASAASAARRKTPACAAVTPAMGNVGAGSLKMPR